MITDNKKRTGPRTKSSRQLDSGSCTSTFGEKAQNMTCPGSYGRVCYPESCKLLVLFYFCKRHND